MSRSKVDFWVGLFVLLGGIALVFLALQAGNLTTYSFRPTYTLTASFNNIGGLKARAAVRSAGVVVGRVESIGFDNETFEAVVTMRIEDGYRFPADTSASILTSGLLGEQYIGLDPGGDDKYLANGDRVMYTQSAVVLENLISQFLYGMAGSAGSGSAPADAAIPGTSTEEHK